jgi:hypothetical protein
MADATAIGKAPTAADMAATDAAASHVAATHVAATHVAAAAMAATATVTGKCHVERERDRRCGDRGDQSRHCLFHFHSPSGRDAAGMAPRTVFPSVS